MLKTSTLILFLLIGAAPVQALRIVSLLPSNTEILESLGAAPDVVGVTRFDGLLARHPKIQDVGDFMQPNLEKIVFLKPDLIVAGYWTSSHIVPRLQKMGYSVVQIRNPRSLEEIYASIRELARAAGRSSAAEPVVRQMQERFKKVRLRAERLPRRLKMYIEIDPPYWTIGGQDYLSEALALAGADNIFSDVKRPAAQVSPEVIIQRNPEVIIVFQAKKADVAARPGWQSVEAVKAGYVIDDLSQDRLSRPSPGLAAGIEAFIERLERLETR